MNESPLASRWSALSPTRLVRARIAQRLGDKALHLGQVLFIIGATLFGGFEVRAADAAKTRELIALLQSNATLEQRARACQQLAVIGTAEAIPAVAPLLSDEKLAHYAREVLEAMPDPAADEALRAALPKVQGDLQIGVIHSLGVRRDGQALDALVGLARSGSPDVARAAILALGRISARGALEFLQAELKEGTPERREAAAEALLVSAERPGGMPPALRTLLCDAVRRASVSAGLRAAATRGAILARHKNALPLLLEQLRSREEALRDIGVRCVRELPAEDLEPAGLLREWEHLSGEMQVLLIAALADRRDVERYRAAIEARTTGSDPAMRIAALQALGKIGRSASVPVLLRVATSKAAPAEIDTALASLGRIAAPDADSALLQAIRGAEPATQVRLIGVLGERNASGATSELMQWARGADPRVREAALRSLAIVAKPTDLPQLIRLAGAAANDLEQTLADRAIVTTSMKVLEPARRAEAVLAAFRTAPDATTRATLLRPLGAIVRAMGRSHDVFFAVRAALQDESSAVRDAALRVLADWPDAAPATTLLEIAHRADASAAERELALGGAIRMATNVAAGRERSPLNVVAAFTQANRAVRTKSEKLMIVSGLGSLRRNEAVVLLQPYLDDPEVRPEAALALLQIAPALANAKQTAGLQPLLERIAASDLEDELRRKAARLAKGGPAEAAKAKTKGKAKSAAAPVPTAAGQLFNGADLAGWDGDPGVWRVQDGVIIGGSLEGNPRNEFLATTRPYRNFVLWLDYKLVGTDGFVNGGVQFRSVRIAQPPNEMSGYQADIGAGHSGCLYDETRRKKFLARATEEQIKRLEKPGDWNRYEIRCEGSRVELTLNGEKTVAYTEAADGIARDGLIALQIHGNCKAEIRFRNIELHELR